jgi:hypothetical protein
MYGGMNLGIHFCHEISCYKVSFNSNVTVNEKKRAGPNAVDTPSINKPIK